MGIPIMINADATKLLPAQRVTELSQFLYKHSKIPQLSNPLIISLKY